MWLRLRKIEGKTSPAAAEIVGIPERTLYSWQKKPVPESTRPHNVRTRRNQEFYDKLKEQVLEIRKENESWGGMKIHARFEAIDHGLDMVINRSMVCRIISELIREKKIKSYYSGKFAKPRSNEVETPPRHHAIPVPDKLRSYAPGDVVQVDTMYVRTPSNRFWYQVNATCIYSRLSFSHIFEAHTAANSAYLLEKMLRDAPFEVRAVQTDQGTEFRGEFERTCKEKGITFYLNEAGRPSP